MAAMEHNFGIILDEWKGMGVEVSKHASLLQRLRIQIDAAEKKGHGATGAKGLGGNVVWVNASITRNG